jgi:hypothetical protein
MKEKGPAGAFCHVRHLSSAGPGIFGVKMLGGGLVKGRGEKNGLMKNFGLNFREKGVGTFL